MTVLLIAEHDNTHLKDATAKAMTAAKALGGDVHVLVAGKNAKAVADAAAKLDAFGARGARDAISMIKYHVAWVLQRVLDFAVQVHGALGLTDDLPLAWWYRHERGARIYDGPDEVHRTAVARRIPASASAWCWLPSSSQPTTVTIGASVTISRHTGTDTPTAASRPGAPRWGRDRTSA